MSNYSQYFAIEKKLISKGYDVDRSTLIWEFTQGEKSGLRDLSSVEYREFILYLNRILSNTNTNLIADKMRKKIISYFHKMGYQHDNCRINMVRVNDWCKKYGYLHKKLNDYNEKELPKLITQVEAVYTSFLAGI